MIVRFWKPYGVLPAFTDPQGRPTLAAYIPIRNIYAAGRLDLDSEGLLLLTDDGTLAHRLTDPAFDHPKTYLAQVERVPDELALAKLRAGGIHIEDYVTRPAQAELIPEPTFLPDRDPPIRYRKLIPTAWLRLTLTEGKNRQVRRMTAAVGYPTLRLLRIGIGTLTLDDLAPGEYRVLTPPEEKRLRTSLRRK